MNPIMQTFLCLLMLASTHAHPCGPREVVLQLRRWATVRNFLIDVSQAQFREFKPGSLRILSHFRPNATVWSKQIGEHGGETMSDYLTSDPDVILAKSATLLILDGFDVKDVTLDLTSQTVPLRTLVEVFFAITRSLRSCRHTITMEASINVELRGIPDVFTVGYEWYFEDGEDKIAHLTEQYNDAFFNVGFDQNNTEICRTIQTRCTGMNQVYNSIEDCTTFYDSLPRTAPGTGCEQNTGNSVLCRSVHLYLAKHEPAIHCSHVSRWSEPCATCPPKPAWVV